MILTEASRDAETAPAAVLAVAGEAEGLAIRGSRSDPGGRSALTSDANRCSLTAPPSLAAVIYISSALSLRAVDVPPDRLFDFHRPLANIVNESTQVGKDSLLDVFCRMIEPRVVYYWWVFLFVFFPPF